MLGLGAVPSIIMFLGFWFLLPESPRWLAKKGRDEVDNITFLAQIGTHSHPTTTWFDPCIVLLCSNLQDARKVLTWLRGEDDESSSAVEDEMSQVTNKPLKIKWTGKYTRDRG
jgi:hypothetical protein